MAAGKHPMNSLLFFPIRPVELMRSLSLAMDISTTGITTHIWRTTLICHSLAEELKLECSEREPLLAAALMHDLDATSFTEERLLLISPAYETVLKDIPPPCRAGL